MYPFWNPYYAPFIMPIQSMYQHFSPQILLNPSSFIPQNQNNVVNNPNSVEISKNIEKNTEEPSKNVIEISSDSQQEIQKIYKPKKPQQKLASLKKLKPERNLGFKEGIFPKENNQPIKKTINLRKRAVLTRARQKKNKQKNNFQKTKQKNKKIQRANIVKNSRINRKLPKNINEKNKLLEKKPRNKEFGKLKKYLKCVEKTADLPQMYIIQNDLRIRLQEKRENLLLRKVD